MDITDREMLARTLMAEAGNQGYGGQIAAGSVIMNRVGGGGYGNGLRGVILQPGQFSAWNSLTGYAGGEQGQDMPNIRPSAEVYKATDDLLSGRYTDPTGGALNYYNDKVSNPNWGEARSGGEWRRIGDHLFGTAGSAQAVGGGAMAALGRQSNTGGQRMAMQPTQRQGILGALGIQKQDRNAQGDTALPFYQRDDFKDTMGKLAVGFNSLTLRPDQNLAANVRENRQERQTNQRASQSMEWLSRQPNSEAYIEMLRAGAPVGEVLQAYQAEVSGGNAPSGVRGLRMQAEDAGLVPGTPEYQTFMLNGGGNPATYRALVMQAKAAGYEPGTPEFERFMASRGAFEKTAQAAEAKNRTDDEQQLIVMTRNMPGLYEVVDELADLASVATYTAAGLAADNVARQLGQPMSEGAKARAAYIATVDNQILPLLRQTFGAAFTAAEGDRLRATLGNDKGSPEEKMATLNAFIRAKQREIAALGGELPERPVAISPVAPATPAGPVAPRTDADLLKQYGVPSK